MLIALFSKLFFLEKAPGAGKRQRSSLSANINERIRDGVLEKNEKRQKTATEKRVRSTTAFLLL